MHRRATFFVLVTVAVLGACSLARGPVPDRDVAEIVERAGCGLPNDAVALGAAAPRDLLPPPAPRRGTVPPGFEPAYAITCDPWLGYDVTADLTSSFSEHRWEGDFDGPIRRIDAPSEGKRLDSIGCPVASIAALPDLWLVAANGAAVMPSYPVDDCGFEQIGGLADIEEMTQASETRYDVQLTPAMLRERMGCGIDQIIPTVGDLVLAPNDYSIRSAVCRHRTGPDGSTTFTGAEELMEAIDDAFRNSSPAGPCGSAATRTVNTSLTFYDIQAPGPLPVLIELDGCRRVIVEGHVATTASAELIELVS